jgi:signal transduction histidine kinase
MVSLRHIAIAIYLLISFSNVSAQERATLSSNFKELLICNKSYFIEDKNNVLTISDVLKRHDFKPVGKDIANFQESKSTFWIKFTVRNEADDSKYLLEVMQPLLDEANFFYPDSTGSYQEIMAGLRYPFNQRKYKQTANFVFDLNLKPGDENTYYLQIRSSEQVLAPIHIISSDAYFTNVGNRNIWFGIYAGIILVMFLYNVFVYISTRDKSYIFYVLHTLFVGITQATLTGYTYKFIWSGSPWFANYSVFLFTCLVSIVGVQFLIEFLLVKSRAPKLFWVLKIFQGIYLIYLMTSLAGYYSATFSAILPTQSMVAIVIMITAVHIYKKGYVEAKFYLIGWSSLMIAIVIYVVKDVGLIPYNNLTAYSLLIGSAVEVTLLSFALADKINIYKRDKEKSQAEAIAALKENERIVREQNVILEAKVDERTHELKEANEGIRKAMKELQDAQSQLVESEKMASLGQLTAGVAHEINNPINFVSSNVKPLNRDVKMLLETVDVLESIVFENAPPEEKKRKIFEYKSEIEYDYLKEEIDQLLKGIGEGASRTAEIVKGLRIFSRLDEDALKKADINEGLESTLIITNNLLNNVIKVQKTYGNLPLVDCYPGKLNQVFLNIISNAIYAIKKKFEHNEGGILTITTTYDERKVYISIADNGIGMDESVKKRIFEPFYTTKEVGEGTGLGLSIVFNTINKHNGQIKVNTELGKGTEFIIELPILQK